LPSAIVCAYTLCAHVAVGWGGSHPLAQDARTVELTQGGGSSARARGTHPRQLRKRHQPILLFLTHLHTLTQEQTQHARSSRKLQTSFLRPSVITTNITPLVRELQVHTTTCKLD